MSYAGWPGRIGEPHTTQRSSSRSIVAPTSELSLDDHPSRVTEEVGDQLRDEGADRDDRPFGDVRLNGTSVKYRWLKKPRILIPRGLDVELSLLQDPCTGRRTESAVA